MAFRLYLAALTVALCAACTKPPSPPSHTAASSAPAKVPEKPAATAEPPVPVEKLMAEIQQALESGSFENALRIAEKALAADANNAQKLALFAQVAQARAAELAPQDRPAANALFLRCGDAMRQYEKLTPNPTSDEQHFIAGVYYSEARALAVDKQLDKALTVLRTAVKSGCIDVETVTNDDDLRSLRSAPEFAKLVEEARVAFQKRAREEVREELAQHQPFPFSFSLPSVDGEVVSLKDYQGKVLVVDFWGTWCPPCRMEIPHFVELYKKHKNAGLEIVGINFEQVEEKEIPAVVGAFVKENNVNYPCLIGDDATRAQVPEFQVFPTTVFVDRNGVVRLKVEGYHPYERLEAIVLELLNEPVKQT